ncbi:hypothetical protein, unlikely [Trypanosoma brucei gambiense DAL972]|uniref:Uncharacterized protein n=1 Tax=Trypanosoma brucei gambiense (strain MHOM/CI/86/DAL972) TaxID=679716 RepID=D0A3V2_TRYB9|nr:hypothetical protein, unlikely [Trypanosoma brucei gambiense DAL972]CBH15946.1 hypothetical protein, unlikely [Trypanosoma brucei gambiense DAL972]|eukprot:XP_011778210.1 hypothetical protein, unlikely [Trypanosoma brucei gambiense DAL972]
MGAHGPIAKTKEGALGISNRQRYKKNSINKLNTLCKQLYSLTRLSGLSISLTTLQRRREHHEKSFHSCDGVEQVVKTGITVGCADRRKIFLKQPPASSSNYE